MTSIEQIFFAYYFVYFFLRTTVNFTFLYPQAWWARLPRFTQPWSSFYLETRLQAKYQRVDGLLPTSSKYDKRRSVMESARGLQPITTAKYKNVNEWIYFSDSDWLTCKSPGQFFRTSWRWPGSLDVCCRYIIKMKSAMQLSPEKGTATEKPL